MINTYSRMVTVVEFNGDSGEVWQVIASQWAMSKGFLITRKTIYIRAIQNGEFSNGIFEAKSKLNLSENDSCFRISN